MKLAILLTTSVLALAQTAPPPTWKPSLAARALSGDLPTIWAKRSVRSSSLILVSSADIEVRTWRRPGVSRMPTMRCPVRTCDSPKSSVP